VTRHKDTLHKNSTLEEF